MPEREYFSLKYAVPGYTLILLVGAINYIPLLGFLCNPIARGIPDLFLAFLTLFSGSALGFLISQIWWLWFETHIRFKLFEQVLRIIRKKYSLVNNDDKKAMAVFDYISRQEENERLSEFAIRRWDLYHLLSATFHTLWIGSTIGIVGRLYYQFVIIGFEKTCTQQLLTNAVKSGELLVLAVVSFFVILLLIFLCKLREKARSEYEKFSLFRVFNCPMKKEKLAKILSIDYYDLGTGFEKDTLGKIGNIGMSAFTVKELNSYQLSQRTGIKIEEIEKLTSEIKRVLNEDN